MESWQNDPVVSGGAPPAEPWKNNPIASDKSAISKDFSKAVEPIGNIPQDIANDFSGGMKKLAAPFPNPQGDVASDLIEGGKDVGSRAMGALQAIASSVTGAAKALAGRPAGEIAQSAGMSPQNAKSYVEEPVTAAASMFGPAGVSKYAPEIIQGGTNLVKGASKFLSDMGEDSGVSTDAALAGAPKAFKSTPQFDTDTAHATISDSYGAAKTQAGKYYDFLQDLGEGKEAKASGIKSHIDSIIDDISSDPLHEARTQLPYLKNLSASLEGSDTMPLNDAVQLKKNLNQNFNPKRFSQGSDTPYQMLGNSVDASLKDAAKTYPDFGQVKDLADKNWLNTVESPFQSNKVLGRIWKPEDYWAKKSVDAGRLEELPDDTKQRAAAMVSKINNPVQLDAVRRVLPQDMADALSQAKIQDITRGSGATRAQAAGKAIYYGATGRLPTALRNAADVINPRYTADEQRLIAAAKTPAPRLSTKYVQPMNDLQAAQQEKQLNDQYEASLASQQRAMTPKALSAPPNQLALPAPNVIGVNTSGVASRQLPGEQTNLGLSAADVERSPAAMSDPRAPVNPYQSKYGQSDFGKWVAQNANKPIMQQVDSIPTAEYSQSQVNSILKNSAFDKLDAAQKTKVNNEIEQAWNSYKVPLRDMIRQAMASSQYLAEATGKNPIGTLGDALINAKKHGGQVNTEPSEAQIKAGNYKKDHFSWNGLGITIENPKGSIRRGLDKNGKKWQVRMPVAYGYIKGHEGADGDHMDVFVGPRLNSDKVWVIDQKHHDTGKFDEHKILIGFPAKGYALAAYRKAFSDGNADKRIHAISECSVEELKQWLNKIKKDEV